MYLAEMVGDRVGEYPGSAILGFLVVALFFFVILRDGSNKRGKP